jgi:hypothetical protein
MTTIRKALIAIAIILLGGGALSQQGGSPPQITFISFPSQIQADGSIVSGFIGFKDPDGDLAKAEFVAVQAKYFPSFTLNLTLKGVKEGSFEFEISTTTPQSVTLRVTLIDEANNRSQPKEFSFEAVGTGAILQVSPTSLNFSSEVGRTPPSQTIQITNAGSGTLSWSANADQPWIDLSPSRGIAPSILTVSLKSSNLEVGNYTGNITITAPGAQGSPAVVRVTLTVRPPAPPAVLDISPRQLEFHGYEGRSNPAPQTLTLRNSGGQPLTWTAQAEARWLTLSSSHGTLQVGESAQVQVFVDLTGLSVGTLQSRITFTAPEAQNSPVIVPVILRIEAVPPAVLEVAPKQLEFRGQEGGSNPVAQILTVRNTGEQVLTWAAQVNKAWLRVNPASGNLQGRESVQVYVYVDLAGLSSGTYEAQITITAPGAQGSPAIVGVTLIVERPAILSVTPLQLTFSGKAGQANPPAQSITIRNAGAGTMTWSARAGASWLSITPANGQVTAGQSQRADVRVELRGLSAGNYSSTITITAPGAQGSPQQLTVQLRVSPAEATIYLTKPVPAPEGAILRLTGPNKFVQVAGNLESPGYIICGPDQRLYVQDFAGGGRILRYNQDGSGRKVIVQDPNLQITTFVFAPNGDLYFGTQKQGLWRLKGADPTNKPEQILPPSTFTFMAEPYAFLTAGPRKGDLLILDSPWSGGRGVSNRVLVARAPDFKVAEPFITTTTYWPAGLALNSKSEIFVTMFYDGRIMRYNPDGSVQGTFSALEFANQIAIDSQGMVWVTNAVFRGNEVSGGLVRFKPNGSSEWMLDRVVLVRGVTVCE